MSCFQTMHTFENEEWTRRRSSITAAPRAREDICGFTAFNDTPKAFVLKTCSLPALLPVLLFFLIIHDFVYLFILTTIAH